MRVALVFAACGIADRSLAIEVVVGRYSGQIWLVNTSSSTAPVLGYRIDSAGGTLQPGGWVSIAANYDADSGTSIVVDPDDNWTIISSTANSIAEGQIVPGGGNNGGTLSPAQALSLGQAWNFNGAMDLTAGLLVDLGPEIPVTPMYTLVSDFDENFRVDRNDLTLWKLCFLSGCNFGDADQNGTVNGSDYLIWLSQVGSSLPVFQSVGLGSGMGAAAVAIPEPTSLALLAVGLFAAFACRRRAR